MVEVLWIWYQTYLRVMSMPALKSHLYVTSISPKEEAMFNIMHCTFVMIHIHQTPDDGALIKGSQVFTTLLQTYFETNLKVCSCLYMFILIFDLLFHSSRRMQIFHIFLSALK